MHHLSLVIIFCIKETSCISLCCNYHKMQQCTIFCNKDTHDIFLSQYPFHTKIHIKNKSFIIATFSVLNTQIIYLYVTIIYICILIYFLSIYQSIYFLSIYILSIRLCVTWQGVSAWRICWGAGTLSDKLLRGVYSQDLGRRGIDSFIYSFFHSPIHLFFHSFIYSFIFPLIYSFHPLHYPVSSIHSFYPVVVSFHSSFHSFIKYAGGQ